jgi:hypothetical protein
MPSATRTDCTRYSGKLDCACDRIDSVSQAADDSAGHSIIIASAVMATPNVLPRRRLRAWSAAIFIGLPQSRFVRRCQRNAFDALRCAR